MLIVRTPRQGTLQAGETASFAGKLGCCSKTLQAAFHTGNPQKQLLKETQALNPRPETLNADPLFLGGFTSSSERLRWRRAGACLSQGSRGRLEAGAQNAGVHEPDQRKQTEVHGQKTALGFWGFGLWSLASELWSLVVGPVCFPYTTNVHPNWLLRREDISGVRILTSRADFGLKRP